MLHRMRSSRLALPVRIPSRCFFIIRRQRTRHNDLRLSLHVAALLVALVQQPQERHGRKPHGRDIDGKRIGVLVKVNGKVLVHKLVERDVLRHLHAWAGARDARVADEEVHVAYFPLDLLGGPLQIGLGRHIALHGNDVGADGGGGLLELVQAAAEDVDL